MQDIGRCPVTAFSVDPIPESSNMWMNSSHVWYHFRKADTVFTYARPVAPERLESETAYWSGTIDCTASLFGVQAMSLGLAIFIDCIAIASLVFGVFILVIAISRSVPPAYEEMPV
jgi:hypothetical protein